MAESTQRDGKCAIEFSFSLSRPSKQDQHRLSLSAADPTLVTEVTREEKGGGGAEQIIIWDATY